MSTSALQDLVRTKGIDWVVANVPPEQAAMLPWMWRAWARPEQVAPPGDWKRWLVLAGRGFGKTRCGAEWVLEVMRRFPGCRVALLGRTVGDVRGVMVDGKSGLLARGHPDLDGLTYNPSIRQISHRNGSLAFTYSSDAPGQLRGPEHHFAWVDELAAHFDREAWDMLQFGLRLEEYPGQRPQVLITTTPKPLQVIRQLLADPHCTVTRGRTLDNAANLASDFLTTLMAQYEGTRMGRQELDGELLADVDGALWVRDWIDRHRVKVKPEAFARVVVAVDPATTSGPDSDMTGIIVAGQVEHGGDVYVLEDLSCRATPDAWARIVAGAYHFHRANLVVAETNQGGEMVSTLLRQVDATVPIKRIHAKSGKHARAEPVAALYEQRRVHHVGTLAALEDQLCTWEPGGGQGSPDRLDALVYAVSELALGIVSVPRKQVQPVADPELERLRRAVDDAHPWRLTRAD